MPAIVAGHRNAALGEEFPQREAHFSCSNESNFHRITLPYSSRVMLPVPHGGEGRKFAGTASNSEYHPLPLPLGTDGHKGSDAAIVPSALRSVKYQTSDFSINPAEFPANSLDKSYDFRQWSQPSCEIDHIYQLCSPLPNWMVIVVQEEIFHHMAALETAVFIEGQGQGAVPGAHL